MDNEVNKEEISDGFGRDLRCGGVSEDCFSEVFSLLNWYGNLVLRSKGNGLFINVVINSKLFFFIFVRNDKGLD